LVPAGITWLHGPVTTAFRFGKVGVDVPAPSTRVNPWHVLGIAVAEVDAPGVVVFHPVVPGACVPGAARSETPHPNPAPVPSHVRMLALDGP
jgi:hypothetical protein